MDEIETEEDDKCVYCPEYDEFLDKIKPILKNRLKGHLTLREKFIRKIPQNTVSHIKQWGYIAYSKQTVPYTAAFININTIHQLIDNWCGPIISKKYKQKFHDINDPTEEMSWNAFKTKSVNWLDQNSWKVSGPFFADHIIETISYLDTISETTVITAYTHLYFAMELLSTKIKGFKRCKEQPLLPLSTLTKNCKPLHKAFKSLYFKLDLIKLKKIMKENNKKTAVTHNKARITATAFSEHFVVHCKRFLNAETEQLCVENNTNTAPVVEYKDNTNSMEVDDDATNTSTDPSDVSETLQSDSNFNTDTYLYPNQYVPYPYNIPPPVVYDNMDYIQNYNTECLCLPALTPLSEEPFSKSDAHCSCCRYGHSMQEMSYQYEYDYTEYGNRYDYKGVRGGIHNDFSSVSRHSPYNEDPKCIDGMHRNGYKRSCFY